MKFLLTSLVSIIFLFGGVAAKARELMLVDKGRSNFVIAIPSTKNCPRILHGYYKKAALELQDVIYESTKVKLPVVEDSEIPASKSVINIGPTVEARQSGLDKEKLDAWEVVVKKAGKNIFLYGLDKIYRKKATNYRNILLGSVRATTLFMTRFLGVRYLMPTRSGRYVPELKKIAVPDSLDLKDKPLFSYCSGRNYGLFYDLANNFNPMPFYGSYGGHSHDRAIPAKKYFKSHPEYFALIRGKRNRRQYCLSHPEVQKLIYKNLLRHVDQGYDSVQLSQSDGFYGCECEKCRKLYNTSDWGEKLWIMHRGMAEKFKKDRPDKKLVVLAYTVTRKPPKSFDSFPDNVLIELCHYAKSDFAVWKRIKGIQGIAMYVYNWGYYKDEGFTPSQSPDFIPVQLKMFRDNRVMGIYRCGFGELFGLEGPVYYAFGQLVKNPDLKLSPVLNEYYKTAYGKAAEPMNKFFSKLYDCVNDGHYPEPDWSDFMYGKTIKLYENQRLMVKRYTSSAIAKMEKYLTQAENTSGLTVAEKRRIKLTRYEFDYLKYGAELARIFLKWKDAGKPAKLLPSLKKAFETRNKYIDSLPWGAEERGKFGNDHSVNFDDWALFYYQPKSMVINGGRFRGLMKGAFSSKFTPEKW